MVFPRLFNSASRNAFTAAKRNFVFNRGLASAAPIAGKVRYVKFLRWKSQSIGRVQPIQAIGKEWGLVREEQGKLAVQLDNYTVQLANQDAEEKMKK